MRWLGWGWIPVMVFGAASAPTVAHACSCIGSVELAWPGDGETIAANARLLMADGGCGIEISGLQVTVDGQPVTVVMAADQWPSFDAQTVLPVVLEPAPVEGATFEAVGCEYGPCGEGEEPPVHVTGVFGPPDAEAPSAVESFDVVHDPAAELPQECGEDIGEPFPVVDWTVTVPLPASGDEPLVFLVEIERENDGDPTAGWLFAATGEESVVFAARRRDDAQGGEVCTTVTPHDMAGNAGTPATTCLQIDPVELPGGTDDGDSAGEDGSDGEPEATDGDVNARGCACRATSDTHLGALALATLFAFRRRRSP